MEMKRLGRAAAVAFATVTLGLAASGAASAAQPGEQCQIGGGAGTGVPVWGIPPSTAYLYSAMAGTWFRIERYFDDNWYQGHSAGMPTGVLHRNWGFLVASSCRP